MYNIQFSIDVEDNENIINDSLEKTSNQTITQKESFEYFTKLYNVDLDLPSKTLWSKFNIGMPFDSVNYLYSKYNSTDYSSIDGIKGVPYSNVNAMSTHICGDGNYVCPLFDEIDMYNSNMYGCIPTKEQLYELHDNTTAEYSYDNGTIILTSKNNREQIYFQIESGILHTKIVCNPLPKMIPYFYFKCPLNIVEDNKIERYYIGYNYDSSGEIEFSPDELHMIWKTDEDCDKAYIRTVRKQIF